MRIRTIIIFCLAVLFTAQPLMAQVEGDGSIYSRFGIGELRSQSSSQSMGLGGGGYAIRTLNYLNLNNPATWGDQVFTRFTAGFRFEGIEARNAQGERAEFGDGTMTGAHLSFPLISNRLGLSISYQPYSRSNFRSVRLGEFQPDPTIPDSLREYASSVEGTGGLQEVRGGAGYRVNEAISIGGSINAIFGIIEDTRRVDFGISEPFYAQTIQTRGTRLSGVTGTIGVNLSLDDLLRDDDLASVGAAFTLPTSLSATQTRTIGRDLDRDTLQVGSGNVELPWEIRGGVAYQPSDRWTLVTDALYAPWSETESTFDEPAFSLPGINNMNDHLRLSGGAELRPAGDDQAASYVRRTGYRLGAYYEQSYIQPGSPTAADTPHTGVHTYALTGGFSLPTMLSGTRIDVNVETGIRGTTENNLVQDRFFGFSITMNAGERWFERRRLQ